MLSRIHWCLHSFLGQLQQLPCLPAHSGVFIECTALDSSAPSITTVLAMVNTQLRQQSVPDPPPFDACGPPVVSVLHLIQLPCLPKCDLPLWTEVSQSGGLFWSIFSPYSMIMPAEMLRGCSWAEGGRGWKHHCAALSLCAMDAQCWQPPGVGVPLPWETASL